MLGINESNSIIRYIKARVCKKRIIIVLLYCLVVAFLLMLFATRSSFMYPFNNWNDANSYYTMGKGLFNGRVLYRDIYDQKGPYLYLIYGIGYLLDNDNFAGVFIIEIISIAALLYGFYLILKLYVRDVIALAIIPILGCVILSSKSFYWGGSCEELFLPYLVYPLYYSVKYYKNKQKVDMPICEVIVSGLCAGIVANMKFNSLGFFVAWITMLCIGVLYRQGVARAIKIALIFIASMLIPFIPWLIYFGVHGAIYDWYEGYVYYNVFYYSDFNRNESGILHRIYVMTKILYWLIISNIRYYIFIIIGMIYIIFGKIDKCEVVSAILERINIIILYAGLFVGIYIGGSHLPYYSLPLAIYAVFGFAMIGSCVGKLRGYNLDKPNNYLLLLILVGSIIVSVYLVYSLTMNKYYLKYEKKDLFQYRFSDIMSKTCGATLLNYGMLDAGLYTVAKVVPNIRYIQNNWVNNNEWYIRHIEYIKEGKVDYVLSMDCYPECIDINYELVDSYEQTMGESVNIYYLFARK